MVNLNEVQGISSSLPPIVVHILGQNGEFFYSLDKIIKRQNMSHDLFYYLSLKCYVTVDHSGQNHIRDNKTTAIVFQFISVMWHLATPFSVFT